MEILLSLIVLVGAAVALRSSKVGMAEVRATKPRDLLLLLVAAFGGGVVASVVWRAYGLLAGLAAGVPVAAVGLVAWVTSARLRLCRLEESLAEANSGRGAEGH